MRRHTGTDSLFLSFETDAFAMQVGALIVLDTTDAPDFSFERLRERYAQRAAMVPKFTWKIKPVPLGIDRPSWIDAGSLDIDEHLDRVTVPAPAGPREIGEVIGRLFEQRLDRDQPLWRSWFLDGLPEGTAALFTVNHHCLMDGTSGASISSVLFDVDREPAPVPPAPRLGPGGRNPSDPEHLARSVLNMATTPLKLPGFVAACGRRAAQLVPDVLSNGVPSALTSPAPRMSFNGAVGDRRSIAFETLPLGDLKAVRRRTGATVNDVIVAVCVAALGRYVEATGEGLPDKPFTVAVPVSMRSPSDDGELTNRVAAYPIRVPTHVADPLERLHAVSEETERLKQLAARFAGTRLPSVGEIASPFVLTAVARALPPLVPHIPVVANTMVSTVRGAPFPLYAAGARLVGMYPTNVLMGYMGLDFTTISAEDRVDVGITVDPDLVPDPWLVAEELPAALDELVRAADAGGG